jgi:hypothetical protein
MVFDRKRGRAASAALTTAVLCFQILAIIPTVLAQPGTPIASPPASEPVESLPPAWLQFGPDGRLIARVIVEGECPALAVNGVGVGMTRRAPASDAFPVVACEATVPFGTEKATILGPGASASGRPDPPHRGHRRHRLPCERLGEEISGLQRS